MAKKVCYLVEKGFTPGFYFTWEDCKNQVSGFKGQKYVGFSKIPGNLIEMLRELSIPINKELSQWLNGDRKPVTSKPSPEAAEFVVPDPKDPVNLLDYITNLATSELPPINWDERVDIWVDGSYNDFSVMAGSGVLIEQGGELKFQAYFSCIEPFLIKSRQAVGEVMAVVYALCLILNLGKIDNVIIHHDFTGLSQWYLRYYTGSGGWAYSGPKSSIVAKSYINFIDTYIGKSKEVVFEKFDSHKSYTPQQAEAVDNLARRGAGIH